MFSNTKPENYTIPPVVLGLLSIIFFAIFFPGEMNDDNINQLMQARVGFYNDHHPALMSFVWRHLLFISDGPLPIYIIHTTLLFCALYNFMKAMPTINLKWFYALIISFPTVLQYSFFIWKDVGMTFCFLFATSIFVDVTLKNRKIFWYEVALIVPILIYGAAIKFHGQFLVFAPVTWLILCLNPKLEFYKVILISIPTYLCFFCIISGINSLLVPRQHNSHAWQYVKLFDLTAISLKLDQPLYPNFIKQSKLYSFERIKEINHEHRIDDISFSGDSPLFKGRNVTERNELWLYWSKTVLNHPILYLEHRFNIWQHDLIDRPYRSINIIYKSKALPRCVHEMLKFNIIRYIIDFLIDCMRFIWWLPLAIAYFLVGIRYWYRSQPAKILALMNGIGLLMLGLLFFMSMAVVPRYIYITIIMLHMSHPFAYLLYRQNLHR